MKYFIIIIFLIILAGIMACSDSPTAPEIDPFDEFIGRVSHGPDTLIVDMTQPLIISFRKQMNHQSVEEALTITPQFEHEIHWTTFPICSPGDSLCQPIYYQIYLYPDQPFTPGTTYHGTIDSTAFLAEDTVYLPGQYEFEFTTQDARLLSLATVNDPVDSAAAFPTGIRLRFNTDIDPAYMAGPLHGLGQVEYELSKIERQSTIFEYKLVDALRAETDYTVSVDGDIFDQWGNTVTTDQEVTFRTGKIELIYHFPNPDFPLKHDRPIVQVRFNTKMDRQSVEEAFSFSGGLGELPGRHEWYFDNAMMYFLDNDIIKGNEYTIFVDSTATDRYGTGLDQPFSYSFTHK